MCFSRSSTSGWRALAALGVGAVLILGASGCSGRGPAGSAPPPAVTGVPGCAQLPFPASEIKDTWALGPDKTLIAYPSGPNDLTYFLAAGGKCEPIIGSIVRAEVRSASAASIEFICRGVEDTPFIAFPYLLVYDVTTGKTEQREFFLDPLQAVEFGGWEAGGHLLTGVHLERGAVVVTFETARDALQTYAGPISHVPHTTVRWDTAGGALTLSFAGTGLAPSVAGQASDLMGGNILEAAVGPAPEGGTVLALRLREPLKYSITHTFGEPCTLMFSFASQ